MQSRVRATRGAAEGRPTSTILVEGRAARRALNAGLLDSIADKFHARKTATRRGVAALATMPPPARRRCDSGFADGPPFIMEAPTRTAKHPPAARRSTAVESPQRSPIVRPHYAG